MYNKIKSLLETSTVRQSSITTISTFASAALGAVFYLILARLLGTSDYGLFSLSLSILVTSVTIADVGMGQGIIRFIGENRDSDKYLGYANFALKTKLFLALVCWLGLTLFASPIASLISQPSLVDTLPVVGFGTFAFIMASYSFSMLQSLQKFSIWGGLQVGSNLIRLFILWTMSFLVPVDTHLAILVFGFTSLFSFLLSWFWLDKKIWIARSNTTHALHFWNFNKWTASFSMLSSVVSRLDIFLASRYLDLSTIGSYSLAVTMVSFMPQLSVAIGAVTSAKLANKSDPRDAKRYLRKSTIFLTLVSIGVALLMIPTALVVVRFAGTGYSAALPPFFVLLVSQIIFMMGNPLRDYILYFLKTPRVFFWTAIVQGIVVVVSGVLLIPKFGNVGTALSVFASLLALTGSCLYFFYRKSK